MRRQLGKVLGRVATPLFVAVVVAAAIAATAPSETVDLPATQPVLGVQGQVHILPWDANDFLATLEGQNANVAAIQSPVRLITSIVSALDGNDIYVDHWEDGYDADPIAAPGPTTELIELDEGQNEVLDNLVAVPRPDDATAPIRYDGGDKLVSTGAIVVTSGGWATGSGTLHAGAVAVRNVNSAGLEFVSPVGQDTTYAAPNAALSTLWDYTGLIVVATEDDTTVTLPDASTVDLDQGDSHLVNGGVDLGDTVTADRPVQVYLSTGDPAQNYEGRMLNLLPTAAWSDSYATPAGSRASAAHKNRVFLYNPGAADITVTATTSGGASSTVSVPASGQANYLMPDNQGVRFSSPGNPFYAVEAITTPESGSTDNSSAHNWGFALTPESALTPMVVIGYGPGSDDFDANGSVDGNDSAVWISAQADTTVYVDLDADPDTGALSDPDGNAYDFSCAATELTPVLIKDVGSASCSTISGYTRATGTGDNDMTGARLYTTDGVSIAAVWGQVPEAANAGTPAIDMGTTVLPFPTIDLAKDAEIVGDDGDGEAVPGDTIRYTITITNRGISPVDDLLVNDQVPANTTYVEDSTFANGSGVPDPGTGTPFPLDEGGLLVPPVLNPNETRTVVYDLLVDDPLPPGVTEVVNEVTLESDYGTYTDGHTQPVSEPGTIGDRIWDDADGDGTQDGGEVGVAGVDLELVDGGGDVVAMTTTDIDGAYTFEGVYPGTYLVRVVAGSVPAGLTPTYDLDGLGSTHEASVTLAEAEARSDVDFGYATSALELEKTVYLGHDGGAACASGGSELVEGETGDPVTYCFEVTNGGAVAVSDVTVDDVDLAVDETSMAVEAGSLATLAPGASVLLSYDAAISGDLTNTATAAATVGSGSVTDTDTAEVQVLGPGISLAKTVYGGHDGGASCATATESVTARTGGEITYCFLVTNSGETNLSAVTFSDADLGIVGGTQTHGLLTPGQSHTFHVEATVDGDLTNTATATGTSPAGVQPTADDTASVDEVHPAIEVRKTAVAGDSDGAGCPGVEDLVRRSGDAVTWCFVVENIGDVDVTDVRLDDPTLGVDQTDLTLLSGSLASLAPGQTALLYLEDPAVTADVDNLVTATAVPPIGADVTDTDTASVDVIHPALTIDKAVYLGGGDGGAGCASAADSVEDEAGQPVTWCFTITNSGDSPLTDITVEDLPLAVDQDDLTVVSGDLADLDAGESVVLAYEDAVEADLLNLATATGTPLAGPDVSDEDAAGVALLVPGLTVDKTVYRGHDGGAGCATASESVVGQAGDDVTWCFTVTNTGDVPLTVGVSDPQTAFSDTIVDLAPGATATVYDEDEIDGDLSPNVVTVTGETPDGDEVTDTDEASSDEIHPAIDVEKTVYSGHDDGASCDGTDVLQAEVGEDVTWCFTVTNTSDDAALTALTLDDAVLGIDESDVSPSGALDGLAPGASVTVYVEGTADGATVNNVTVGGTAPDGSTPTATDSAEIEAIAPQIGIAKKVVEGPTGNGDGTYTLTYRLRVANAGETRLDGVQVTDDLTRTFAGARSFEVDVVESADFEVNPGYDGRPGGSTELLAGTDSLAVGQAGDVLLTVTLDPGDDRGPYENSAHATGTSPVGDEVGDDSDSGSVADPGDPNSGEPGDTTGTDDPVPFVIPAVDLTVTKGVHDVRRTGPRTAVVDWRIVVTNDGPGDDPGPITVTDELDERLSYISASGDGWACGVTGQVVTCVWDEPLAAGESTSEIQVLTDAEAPGEDATFHNGVRVASTLTEDRTDNNEAAAQVDAAWVEDPGTPSTLPRTGATVGGLLLLGLGLVFGGRLLQRRARGVVG